MARRYVVLIMLMVMTVSARVYGGSLTKYLKNINNTTVGVVDAVIFPYLKDGISTSASTSLHLERYHEESNEIIDEEEWYDQYNIRDQSQFLEYSVGNMHIIDPFKCFVINQSNG